MRLVTPPKDTGSAITAAPLEMGVWKIFVLEIREGTFWVMMN
jgi:hypothetical protein